MQTTLTLLMSQGGRAIKQRTAQHSRGRIKVAIPQETYDFEMRKKAGEGKLAGRSQVV